MKWNKQFIYPKSVRSIIDEERHYSVDDEKLPSVTTILAATQSDEKNASLQKWKDKVGSVEADNIKNLPQPVAWNSYALVSRSPFKRSRATGFERLGAGGREHGKNYNRKGFR
jgi:hypothetical protein